MEEDKSQQEGADKASSAAPKKTPIWPAIILAAAPFAQPALIFLIVITLVFALLSKSLGEPANDTSSLAGSVSCQSWSEASPGWQDKITAAANKTNMPPALIGAIFLSEHSNSWPPAPSGDWAQGGNGKGPYQIENWDGFWKNVTSFGYGSGSGNVQDMYDASLATAVSIKIGFQKSGIIKSVSDNASNITDQKYVMFAGMFHNRGEGAALDWAKGGFDMNNPPANTTNPGWEWGANDYAKRTWSNFQGLDVDCKDNAVYATGLGLPINHLYQINHDGHQPWASATKTSTGKQIFSSGRSIAQVGCGLTSMTMVTNFLKNSELNPLNFADLYREKAPTGDFSPSVFKSVESITNTWSQSVDKSDSIPTDKIKSELNAKHPVIMRIQPGGGYPNPKNKGGHKAGHYLVISAVQDNCLIAQDPTDGPNTCYPINSTARNSTLIFYSFSL